MGRKKKDKDAVVEAEDGEAAGPPKEPEEEEDTAKRAGRRTSKPSAGKWATLGELGGIISDDSSPDIFLLTFSSIDNSHCPQ
jgi:hypothetical protein